MRIKICGATSPADVELLGGLGVDYVGLWHGIPRGRSELPPEDLQRLATMATAAGGPEPVLVTFLNDREVLRKRVLHAGVRWVQLHGYQPPSLVRALKADASNEINVVKVLHVGASCVERNLIGSYERAGVDVFLLDAVAGDGSIGSTGRSLDPGAASGLVDATTRPCFLAGGISASNFPSYALLTRHRQFFGIDVDTNARGEDGRFSVDRIAAIQRAWRCRGKNR